MINEKSERGNAIIIGVIVGLVVIIAGGYFFLRSDNEKADGPTNTRTALSETGQSSGGQYVTYSKSEYENASSKKRVLFFHAGWCPSCITANSEFEANSDQIPADVVLLKTDYDTETVLKDKYGVTYQHTFVQVDDQGNQLAKWNGGTIEDITSNII